MRVCAYAVFAQLSKDQVADMRILSFSIVRALHRRVEW